MSLFIPSDLSSLTQVIYEEVKRKTETEVLAQLNDLIEKGLLVVNIGPGILVQSIDSDKIEYRPQITLELKDQEYIKQLEAKLEKFRKIEEALK